MDRDEARGPRVAFEQAPHSAAAEAFRSLRTSLQFLEAERTRVVAVTSPAPDEGKTMCAVNMAVSLARSGRRVLLVDADLRQPGIHDMFALGRVQGLANLLGAQAGDDLIQESGVENLDILPGGTPPPNPSELLERPALAAGIARWRERYDHIVFDTPALLSVTDGVLVARRAGSAIMVARTTSTRDRALMRAVALLREAGVDVLGAILNDANMRSGAYDGYGYYGHRYAYASGRPEGTGDRPV